MNDTLAADLRHLADMLDSGELTTNYVSVNVTLTALTKVEIADLLRKLAHSPHCSDPSKIYIDDILMITTKIGTNLTAFAFIPRDEICSRVQVGTETVEETDPDAPKIRVERPVYQWKCDPILSEAIDE